MDLRKYLRGLSQRLHKQTQSIESRILYALEVVGERAVEIAKRTKTYKDNTGNLTASIGYGVYHNGVEYSVGGFGDGVGRQAGLKRLAEIAQGHRNKQFVLILVAGMEYALYVERSGYVVLDGASMQLDSMLKDELSKVKVYEQ